MSNWNTGLLWLIVLLTIIAHPAFAQRPAGAAKDYPSKPIRFVVPYPPGGGTDIVARTVGQMLVPRLGQNIVYDNRGGAGGVIGADVAAKSAPDGYTVLFFNSSYVILPFVYKNLPYDPVRDLMPVTLLADNFARVLVVNPSLPVRSVKEFITLAKANPGKIDYGSAGLGNSMHLAAELFGMLAGIKMNHVPYKGGAAAITDTISGQIQAMLVVGQSVLPHIRSGRLRALAITGEPRWSQLPDVPTLEESGVKGFNLTTWYGLWFPARTRIEYVDRIQSEVAKVVNDPETKRLFDEQGLKGVASTPAEFERAIQEQLALVKKIATMTGIEPQ